MPNVEALLHVSPHDDGLLQKKHVLIRGQDGCSILFLVNLFLEPLVVHSSSEGLVLFAALCN